MKLLILSRKPTIYSTRRLREAARIEGHACLCVDPLRCVLYLEKGSPRVKIAGEEVTGIDAVIPRVGTYGTEYGLAVVQQFELMGVPVVNRSAAIAVAKNKLACLQLLVENHIPVPPTVMMRFPTSLLSTIDDLGGVPVILKLLRGTQGAGVILAESNEAAESMMDTVWSLGEDIMVQKFISESRGRDIRALVMGGEVIASMRRVAKDGDFRSNIHRGGIGVRVDLSQDVKDLAIRAASVAGLDVAGVDILESKSGPLVVEVNASPGFQGLEEATDRDIAVEYVRFAVKRASLKGRAQPALQG